jgi:hypothetical protein
MAPPAAQILPQPENRHTSREFYYSRSVQKDALLLLLPLLQWQGGTGVSRSGNRVLLQLMLLQLRNVGQTANLGLRLTPFC